MDLKRIKRRRRWRETRERKRRKESTYRPTLLQPLNGSREYCHRHSHSGGEILKFYTMLKEN
jgi:hypothetical protein